MPLTVEKTSEFIKLANEFDHWMNSNRQRNQSDMELLLAWLDSDAKSRSIIDYEDFLALAQEVGSLGYKTMIDVPISAEDYANRTVINKFESWLKKTNQPLMSSADYLLAWIDEGSGSRSIKNYQHFLQLTQTLVNRGYKPSIDVLISEEDYSNREVVNQFERWLKENNQPSMRVADYLLAWIDDGGGLRYIKNYQHFLQLTQTLVNRGYKPSIDIPISEEKFEQNFLSSQLSQALKNQDYKLFRYTPISKGLLKQHFFFSTKLSANRSDKLPKDAPTIFFEIAKTVLKENMTKYKREKQRLPNVGSVLLDTKLQIIDELFSELDKVTNKHSDLERCDLLRSIIDKYKEKNSYLGLFNIHRQPGALEKIMTETTLSLQIIYDKLKEIKLLDIPYDNEPFNQFRYYMALYFSHKAVESSGKSLSTVPKIKIAQQETCILQTLRQCKFELGKLDKEDYCSQCELVAKKIELLKEQIIRVGQMHESVTFISSLSGVAPPEKHSIESYLDQAQQKIKVENDSTTIFSI